jgi:N-acetylmuramic acid 6-phosphate etherase
VLNDPTRLDRLMSELATLATEATDVSRGDLDERDTLDLAQMMNQGDREVPAAVGEILDDISRVVDAIAERFRRGGRLVYLGAGTAGRMGVLDASECPPTFGTDPSMVLGLIAGGPAAIKTSVENAEDDLESAARELEALAIGPDDSVVGISASGRTPYVIAGLTYAKRVGAFTAAIASQRGSSTGAVADIALEVQVGPEFVSGSTRLKSGTAQKLIVNMLTTLSMIQLGKTYLGVMVDLRATNEKLYARSIRTVIDLTGASPAQAAAALEAAAGSVKLAILMIVAGADSESATNALHASDGLLRDAIAALAAEIPPRVDE